VCKADTHFQAVFAEQGFIVVAPNITGSTGYGQDFTDAINQNWGGSPYEDIEEVFKWVGENMPEADNNRAVALGASYGGYMMNCKSRTHRKHNSVHS
jgi:dipeptidyl aminopeptidase/acylaminoacyl peptidase